MIYNPLPSEADFDDHDDHNDSNSIEDDAALAARLQREYNREDNKSNSRPSRYVPLDDFANENNVDSDEPLVFESDNILSRIPTKLIVMTIWGIFEMIVSLTVLFFTWNTTCDAPIRYWLLIFTLRYIILLPLEYTMQLRPRYRHMLHNILTWVIVSSSVVFLMGQIWIYQAETCPMTSPTLYTYCLALVIASYLAIAFPLLFLGSLCICLPLLTAFRIIDTNSNNMLFQQSGAPDDVINSLPTRNYVAPQSNNNNNDDDNDEISDNQCAICMEDFKNGDVLRMLRCDHEFHNECVDRWLRVKHNCPLCRMSVLEQHEDNV